MYLKMFMARLLRRWWYLLSATVLGSCDSTTAPVLPVAPDVRSLVTGAAAQALEASGRFVIPSDLIDSGENVSLVTSARARMLAAAFMHSYGPTFLGSWVQDRGGSITLAALSISERAYPAQSPYAEVPKIGCHPSDVRLFGSFYLLTADGAEPMVRIATSAQLADYAITPDGDLDEPSRTGQDFIHEGIRQDRSIGYLLSPEQAVFLVAERTGAMIIDVPRLALRDVTFSPNTALWRVALDRDARVRGSNGAISQTRSVYVDWLNGLRVFVAAVSQPTSVLQHCSLIDENLVNHGDATVEVPVRAGHPVLFEQVTIVR